MDSQPLHQWLNNQATDYILRNIYFFLKKKQKNITIN